MTIFLILAPYGAFTFLMLVTSAAVSLFASTAVCIAGIAFGAIGLYVALIDPALGASAVHFAADTGILLVTLFSILIRYPFTLQYALEVTDAETAKLPGFIRANYIITWAWAAASLLMMIGNAAMIYVPWLPFWGGLLVAFAARNCAIYFTHWYPQYVRAKYGPPPAGAFPGPQ